MKVGDKIWIFDINFRVYRERKPGNAYSSGGPIYREHWRPVEITGETSRSWITNRYGKKVPKKGEHRGWAFTEQEVDDDVWVHEHRYRIVREIERLGDAAMLRSIAAAIGYKPTDSDTR